MGPLKGLAAALGFCALTAAPAQADGEKIDCADTDLALHASDFEITCKDYSDPSAVSNAGRLGYEYLEAVSQRREQIIGVADIRAIGSIYLPHKGFEEDFRGNFPGEELAGWHAAGEVAGFEYAEYDNRRIGSDEEECIAFRRTLTRRDSGFGRKVIGFGCTTAERTGLIETLKQLDAPGG